MRAASSQVNLCILMETGCDHAEIMDPILACVRKERISIFA